MIESIDLLKVKNILSNNLESKDKINNAGNQRVVLYENSEVKLLACVGKTLSNKRLINSGKKVIKLLKGSLQIRSLHVKKEHNGTTTYYLPCSSLSTTKLCVESVFHCEEDMAISIDTSSDSIWIEQYSKLSTSPYNVIICADTMRTIQISLINHVDARLFNFIEILARSSCEDSLNALKQLINHYVDEVAWRAIEGLSSRSPDLLIPLLRKIESTHESKIVRNRAHQLLIQGV
ncbi:HEAT repeat domain-containing protein [Pseudoalteromonas piscicida]|uniref:HEAT repeat domain-containing protein n=1 Tax=Pseudoalteromonas piscicida TaxID=43662 RepID=A0A2A5JJZ5_PSEO7|nr:HEAT repeat domain-containing protein [Pseudoalteromonas piscicida]PCK29756.1 hypothetical protein CEX98_21085 [Pseudoalteromonas piscicida]